MRLIEQLKKFYSSNINLRSKNGSKHPSKWLLFLMSDWIVKKLPLFKKKNGVGIILVNRLGDAIVSLPLIDFLTSKHDQSIEIIGDLSWQVLNDNLYKKYKVDFIDERKYREAWLYRIRINLLVRLKNWEYCYCFMHHRIEMRDEYLVLVSGADRKIVSELPNFFIEKRWYPWIFEVSHSHMDKIVTTTNDKQPFIIKHQEFFKVPHVIERQSNFASNLFGPNSSNEIMRPAISTQKQPVKRLSNQKYIVFNFGASGDDRIWKISNWTILAKKLLEDGFVVVFSGGPNEKKYESEIIKALNKEIDSDYHSNILIYIDRLKFIDLIGMFQNATLYIGPDTGTSHLAVLLGIPIIILLVIDRKSIHFDRFGDFFPYPDNYLLNKCEYIFFDRERFKTEISYQGIDQSEIYKKTIQLISD